MKFRVEPPGWPLAGGARFVPPGTIFDFAIPEQKALAQGLIPINATPLDAEAHEAQLRAYPEHRHLLGGGWENK